MCILTLFCPCIPNTLLFLNFMFIHYHVIPIKPFYGSWLPTADSWLLTWHTKPWNILSLPPFSGLSSPRVLPPATALCCFLAHTCCSMALSLCLCCSLYGNCSFPMFIFSCFPSQVRYHCPLRCLPWPNQDFFIWVVWGHYFNATVLINHQQNSSGKINVNSLFAFLSANM